MTQPDLSVFDASFSISWNLKPLRHPAVTKNRGGCVQPVGQGGQRTAVAGEEPCPLATGMGPEVAGPA